MFIWWYGESCPYLANYACSVVSDFDSGILTWLQTLKKFEEYIFSWAGAHTHIDRIAHGISEPYKYRQTPNNDDDKLIITSIFVAPAEPSQDMGKVRKMDYVLVSDNNKTDVFFIEYYDRQPYYISPCLRFPPSFPPFTLPCILCSKSGKPLLVINQCVMTRMNYWHSFVQSAEFPVIQAESFFFWQCYVITFLFQSISQKILPYQFVLDNF